MEEIDKLLESLAKRLGNEYHFKYSSDDIYSVALFDNNDLIEEIVMFFMVILIILVCLSPLLLPWIILYFR